MSRIVLLGCKSTTRYLYGQLRQFAPAAALVTIPPKAARKAEVADYDDLRDLSSETEVYHASRYALTAPADVAFFEERAFDIAFVIGWQRIIPEPVLRALKRGAFGMHGSSQNLPYGRGRSPMNWSLIEGRKWFFTNLFRYLPGVDDGPVAATACFSINGVDTAETLHFKNLLAMADLVRRNLPALLDGSVTLHEQPDGEATYYPKRKPDDGNIDWSGDALAIERHIRAVAPPFAGAFSHRRGERVRIARAGLFYTDLENHPYRDVAPGTICAVLPNGKFCVRALGGVLLVHEFEIEGGEPLSAGDVLNSGPAAIRRFPRNPQGYFDMQG